jgi:hypothetical protein
MQPQPPPEWAFLELPPTAEGIERPPLPLAMGVGLTEPDAAGHQWLMLKLGDGTASVDLKIPWQIANQMMAALSNGVAAKVAEAAALAGPQLVVAPGGIDLSKLNIGKPRGNGGQPHGGR